MIFLNTTLKSLEVKLGGAITTNELDWTLSAIDIDADQKLDSVIANDGVTTGGTAVVVLSAPATDHSRQVKLLTVYNKDTVDADVIVELNNNGTRRRLIKQTLEPGESLIYVS